MYIINEQKRGRSIESLNEILVKYMQIWWTCLGWRGAPAPTLLSTPGI